MTRSRTRLLAYFALAALAAAAGSSPREASGQSNPQIDRILTEGKLAAADAFLASPNFQAQLKAADPDLYGMTFTRATELADIGNLLAGDAIPSVYRTGLLARDGCVFCQSPTRLLKWAGDNFENAPIMMKALRKGVLEWDSLDPEPRDWLAKAGASPSAWANADLRARYNALKPWIDAQNDVLLKANPADEAALNQMRARIALMGDYLDGNRNTSLWNRYESAQSAVKGLNSVVARIAAGGDARLQGLLAKAKAAPTLEERLTLLSQIFDGLGETNAAVRSAAPPRSGQVFDADSRRTVGDLLKTSLLREIAGTWAGDTLVDFYQKYPLDLRVGPSKEENEIGWYQPGGGITFNEAYIQRFLKTRGKDIRDLVSGPDSASLLNALTVELSPLFVHESTHKRQYQWAVDSKVNEVGVQNLETEANETESLYVVEKSMRDPAFLALMKADANTPGLARQALDKAKALAEGGGVYFRDTIDDIYMDSLSLEGDAWKTIHDKKGAVGSMPDDYAAWRSRLEWQNGQIDAHLNALLQQGAAANFKVRTVPSP
jgi:hypothetical protein